MNMRLLGARSVKEVVPEMVDSSNIHLHIVSVPSDNLYESNCKSCVFSSGILMQNPCRRATSRCPSQRDQEQTVDISVA
jgi:hypothetical protein